MYYLAKFIRNILLKLPLGVCLILGKAIGLFFYFNPKKRRTAFRNIKSAFPEKTKEEVLRILKKSFNNFGLTVIESLILPRIYNYVGLKEKEKSYPDGGILVGIHAGNWELAVSYWAQKYNFAVLAQKQKQKTLNKFINEIREEGKARVCHTLKEFIKCLKENYMVGVVIDHGAEKGALDVEFFSQEVPTPKGAIYLAKKFNKKIYAVFFLRQKGFSHIFEIGEAIDAVGRDDRELLRDLNKIYEDYLKKYPWEYFWYYKRFKHKKNRDVLILSDGKMGHLKQSKALLSLLREEGRKIRSKVIEVRYKDKLRRSIADILACFSGGICLGCGWCLSFLVDKKTKEELDMVYADIVISTGSFIAPINKLFSSYLGAKSAVVLRPNIPLKKFDLAVIPEHDRVYANNAVMIKGALFYPDNLEEKTRDCKSFFDLSGAKKLSLFIGGPLADRRKFEDNLKLFIPKLKNFSLEQNYKILVSTSRRTPHKAELYLERELGDFANTEAFVVANRDNYNFIFEGFCVLADIIFVSSESISMVSEAASFKKPCVCAFLETGDDKRKIFLESMKDEVIFLKKPYDLDFTKPRVSSIFDKNKEVLKKKIGKLL